MKKITLEKVYPHSYKLVITDLSGGQEKAFEIYVPAFKAHIFGDTIAEALKGYMQYFDEEVEIRKKKKIAMPRPDYKSDEIKQVPLRLSEQIYQGISAKAKKQGQSFNSFVAHLLERVLV